MDGTRKILGLIARASLLWLVIASANLVALYITAGVIFKGDWDYVNGVIEGAYNGVFEE
jgi:hypothetical protein